MVSNHDNQAWGTPPADGNRNWGGVLIGVNWAVFTPALIVVVLRLISRTFFTHNLGWDDFFMVLTEVSSQYSETCEDGGVELTDRAAMEHRRNGVCDDRGSIWTRTAQILHQPRPFRGLSQVQLARLESGHNHACPLQNLYLLFPATDFQI